MPRYPDEPVVVESFRGEWTFLSNFYPSPVYYRTVLYPTVEHAYQAAKTLSLVDRERIRLARTPGEAKRLGRRVKVRPGWALMQVDVMRHLLEQKFTDYPTLRKALLSTGDAPLVEGNAWGDRFWGVCAGQGENHLGRLIMAIRSTL
jgi:ribA/ribD-fused uncharacterized protein